VTPGVFIALLIVGTSASADGLPFIDLSRPAAEIQQLPSACPIRAELKLGKLMASASRSYRTGKPSLLRCDGTYISVLLLELLPGSRGLQSRLHVVGHVALPQGGDKLAALKYWLLQGEREVAAGAETIKADEGETNWGEGADLWFDEKTLDPAGPEPVLRLELALSDR
jgi:hypothetical protein